MHRWGLYQSNESLLVRALDLALTFSWVRLMKRETRQREGQKKRKKEGEKISLEDLPSSSYRTFEPPLQMAGHTHYAVSYTHPLWIN